MEEYKVCLSGGEARYLKESKMEHLTEEPMAKQPWQMTKEEFKNYYDTHSDLTANASMEEMLRDVGSHDKYYAMRKYIVRDALSEGKSVPGKVLHDYPRLVAMEHLTEEKVGSSKGRLKKITLENFLSSKIPEFKKIQKDYFPKYWLKEANRLIGYTIRRWHRLGYFPDLASPELVKYITRDVLSEEHLT